jgi:hypothetical protein
MLLARKIIPIHKFNYIVLCSSPIKIQNWIVNSCETRKCDVKSLYIINTSTVIDGVGASHSEASATQSALTTAAPMSIGSRATLQQLATNV